VAGEFNTLLRYRICIRHIIYISGWSAVSTALSCQKCATTISRLLV